MNRVAKLWGGVAGGLGAAGGLLNASLGMLKAAVPGTQRDMVKLRLQRFGRRNLPFYRIVAADARHKRDGRCIEYLGTYNPIANKFGEKLVTLNMERAKYWLVCGAQPTDRIAKILGGCNILPAKISYNFSRPKIKAK
ncbi:ribosomal protein S16 domain-containing protein [Baffinella frigidus]|nr:ribosomal protein S16 domain-containing protein [Cryptophyta sp. CCMP2293]|mmetsp:Transcript_67825/g.161932  ORF Transcript_67825/g.161932 Transcript_67825/m.161932 type:complete len:138 (+) Transcript_67825:67-480(+)